MTEIYTGFVELEAGAAPADPPAATPAFATPLQLRSQAEPAVLLARRVPPSGLGFGTSQLPSALAENVVSMLPRGMAADSGVLARATAQRTTKRKQQRHAATGT